MNQDLALTLGQKRAFICDMDGVIYHGERILPGARELIEWFRSAGKRFLFLTNSAERSPEELRKKLQRLGIEVTADHLYTSGMATAGFLQSLGEPGTAYVIGDPGLITALREIGFSIRGEQADEDEADYVVVGETEDYTYEKVERAVNLVARGAKLIGTNPDISRPTEAGIAPGCAALIAPIELATGRQAYFVGKPNPLMIRQALHQLGCRSEEALIIGDRMDTDIVAGVETEIETILVLSGVTGREELARFAYQPDFVLTNVGEIVAAAKEAG
ncbi:MAG: HAD-IIA family hydrolase [Spirochaetes bacterium]|jgi:NagD protein|nr:HAD-IIA family hydrolase [Spirochaetota bacterium]